jgi:hypothetical protein
MEATQMKLPSAIGEVVHTALTVRKRRIVYTVVKQKFKNWTLPMLFRQRILDQLIGKQLGLAPSVDPAVANPLRPVREA